MSTVFMHSVVSVDGFIADTHDGIGRLFDWYYNGPAERVPGHPLQPPRFWAEYVRPAWAGIGAMVIGRHLFDMTNGWDGSPPAGIEHVVVVSHRPKPEGWHPQASYAFVDDVTEAVARARDLAGDGHVAVAPGEVGGQAFALGLVDEVAMDVLPVVLGSGKRYFGSADTLRPLEEPHLVIQGDSVLHLRYRVRRDHGRRIAAQMS